MGVLGAAVISATTVASIVLLPTAPAAADTTPINQTVGTVADALGTTTIDIPRGVRPTAVNGALLIPESYGGTVDLLVGDRVVESVEARPFRRVRIPLRPADVDEFSQVEIGVRYDLPRTDETCQILDPVGVSLTNLVLQYAGEERPATSVGDFLPPSSPRVDVQMPAEPSDDVIEAALTAVAALSARYPEGTEISLGVGRPAPPAPNGIAGYRVVRLASGDGSVQTSISAPSDVQTLTLTGSGSDLVAAARALGSDRLSLADSDATQGLSLTPEALSTATDRTLSDFGVDDVELRGYGRNSRVLGLSQDAFGGPVSGLDLHIEGTHTSVAEGAAAQLDTYFNGFLIDSQVLDSDIGLSFDVSVPDTQINTDNGLEFALTAIPQGGDCVRDTRQLPMEVFLDGERSTVTATRGSGKVAGFDAYPQAFGGRLPVAIRPEGASRAASAIDAAYIISSLQRAAATPLRVSLVGADEFIAGDDSGLLVGAVPGDATALEAPLRLDTMRLLDFAEATFQVGTNQPFATLESAPADDRHVLLLGSWAPNADVDTAALTRRAAVAAGKDGWGALNDDVLIASGDTPPFTLSAQAIVPQDERVQEKQSFGWWFVVGLAVLILLLVLGFLSTRRRNSRVREVVDAQERADASVTLTGRDTRGPLAESDENSPPPVS